MVVDKELSEFEAALRLDIERATGVKQVVDVPEKAKVAARKKFERQVILGISNDRGHTVQEFVFDSKQSFELPAEMEARRAAKAKGLNVFSLISNVRVK